MLVGDRNTSPSEIVGNSMRQRAGREHAALDRLDQFGHAAMAVVEPARRSGDADDRLCQELARIAHRARERAPQIGGESRIAVVGEPAFEALAFALRHAAHPCTKARRGSNGFRRAPAFSRPWRPEALGDARLEGRGGGRPGPCSRPADVRTRVGRARKGPASSEPNQTSRAALLVPGPATSAPAGPTVAGRSRLKCVRTDPGFSPGRARPPPGCRAARPCRAGDREAEDPETPPCEDGLSAASTRPGVAAVPSHRPSAWLGAFAPPPRPKSDAAPLSNASGSAPRGQDDCS